MFKMNKKTSIKKTSRKIISIMGITILFIMVIGGVLKFLSQLPMTQSQAISFLDKSLSKKIKPEEDFSGIQAYVSSKNLDLDWKFASGISLRANLLSEQTPFHAASVGKLFTATVIYQLIDEHKISLDAPIELYLDKTILDDLFEYEGVDYRSEVTIRHLLSHTSGVADYFGGSVLKGEPMMSEIHKNQNYSWTPMALISFTQENQKAISKPGQSYLYSDTGYALLGFIIEKIEKKPFENVLEDRIFKPLSMNQTYMPTRSKPLSGEMLPVADLWVEGVELGDKNVLSVDWAGGGVISTIDDLMKFSIALHEEQLISETSLKEMYTELNRFEQGIFTGTGGMIVHFKDFFPLLNLPDVTGHIGVTATHLFYDATTGTHVILNFGSTSQMENSFKALIEILSVVKRIEPAQ